MRGAQGTVDTKVALLVRVERTADGVRHVLFPDFCLGQPDRLCRAEFTAKQGQKLIPRETFARLWLRLVPEARQTERRNGDPKSRPGGKHSAIGQGKFRLCVHRHVPPKAGGAWWQPTPLAALSHGDPSPMRGKWPISYPPTIRGCILRKDSRADVAEVARFFRGARLTGVELQVNPAF